MKKLIKIGLPVLLEAKLLRLYTILQFLMFYFEFYNVNSSLGKHLLWAGKSRSVIIIKPTGWSHVGNWADTTALSNYVIHGTAVQSRVHDSSGRCVRVEYAHKIGL